MSKEKAAYEPKTAEEKLLLRQIEHNKGKAEELINDNDKMELFLERLEKKLAQIPYAGKYLSDVPVLVSLVRAYINKSYTEVPLGSILAVVGALIYFLSPVDLIPDVVPGVGLLDDAAVITIALKLVHDDVADYREWKEAGKQG